MQTNQHKPVSYDVLVAGDGDVMVVIDDTCIPFSARSRPPTFRLNQDKDILVSFDDKGFSFKNPPRELLDHVASSGKIFVVENHKGRPLYYEITEI